MNKEMIVETPQTQVQPLPTPPPTTIKPKNVKPETTIQWVSYRGTVSITTKSDFKECQFFMVNKIDSIIYVNINVFGIELARVVAKPKELIYVNKLTKEYYKGGYDFAKRYLKFDTDYYTLEKLLNGNGEPLAASKSTIINCTFDDYHPIDSTNTFFHHIDLRIPSEEMQIDAKLKNVKINIPGPTSIRIPDGFKEIKL